MSIPSPRKPVSAAWVALLFGLGFALDVGLGRLERVLSETVSTLFWEKGVNLFYALNAQALLGRIQSAYECVLYIGSPIAFVVLMGRPLLARRRLRRPGPGPMASFVRARPRMGQVIPWAAGLMWFGMTRAMEFTYALYLSAHIGRGLGPFWHAATRVAREFNNPGFLAGSVIGIVGIASAVRYALGLVARDDGATPAGASSEATEDRSTFAAVAVTPSTQGAVAGLALISMAMMVCVATLRSNAALAAMVLAYVLVTMGTATLFRRVSRIAVGIDGILVLGADKARFFGYADISAVTARGSDVLLKGRGKTTLKLQLHDADVSRAPELAARIEQARQRAAAMQREGADQLMQAAKSSLGASTRLASSARGGLDYRQPALAREQLWDLVEGPVSSAEARRVAAQALAHDLVAGDRERLRVAAERCAEPQARVALVRVLEQAEDEDVEEAAQAAPLLRKREVGG